MLAAGAANQGKPGNDMSLWLDLKLTEIVTMSEDPMKISLYFLGMSFCGVIVCMALPHLQGMSVNVYLRNGCWFENCEKWKLWPFIESHANANFAEIKNLGFMVDLIIRFAFFVCCFCGDFCDCVGTECGSQALCECLTKCLTFTFQGIF